MHCLVLSSSNCRLTDISRGRKLTILLWYEIDARFVSYLVSIFYNEVPRYCSFQMETSPHETIANNVIMDFLYGDTPADVCHFALFER